MIEQIQGAITAALPDAEVHVIDPQNDGQHFQSLVISAEFVGMPLVKQHQKVMNTLKAEFASNVVHALALKTFTPEKWATEKENYIR